MTTDTQVNWTPQDVADSLAKTMPRRMGIYRVELVQVSGGGPACIARARVGETPHAMREISGLGNTMDAAVAALHDEARRLP